jgi:hypothetical protein
VPRDHAARMQRVRGSCEAQATLVARGGTQEAAMRRDENDPGRAQARAAAQQLSRHDGHPFAPGAGASCSLCGESSAHILHHPTRIRAACALRGIDPEPLLARPER